MPVAESNTVRLHVALQGAVQGVGFRPFVFRLAAEMGLAGWVCNSSAGLTLEVEGAPDEVHRFLERLDSEKPTASVVLTRETAILAPAGLSRFEIRTSDEDSSKTAAVLPDLATCPACLAELRDPVNRRYGYPFTNCTHCGPRYTIIDDIPYDRPRTTMRGFAMCPECEREYTDPGDRRFHAQPIACPRCGPRLWAEEKGLVVEQAAIERAAETIRSGGVVALKGIGGFQLLVDARQAEAVAHLRTRKRREEKPFALMMPSLEVIRQYCDVSEPEEHVLTSATAPRSEEHTSELQ